MGDLFQGMILGTQLMGPLIFLLFPCTPPGPLKLVDSLLTLQFLKELSPRVLTVSPPLGLEGIFLADDSNLSLSLTLGLVCPSSSYLNDWPLPTG